MSTESFNIVHSITVNGGNDRLFGYPARKTTTTTSVIEGLGVSDLTDIIASACGVQGMVGKFDDPTDGTHASEVTCGGGARPDGNDERRSRFVGIVNGLSRWIDGNEPVFHAVIGSPVEDFRIDVDVRIRIERVVR